METLKVILVNALAVMGGAIIGRLIIKLRDKHNARSSRHTTTELAPKKHWHDMDYAYLKALNELNISMPTGDEEEKSLARYLEFNSEEDHNRRKDKHGEPITKGGVVIGHFNTLLAPGFRNDLMNSALGQPLSALNDINNLRQQMKQDFRDMMQDAQQLRSDLRGLSKSPEQLLQPGGLAEILRQMDDRQQYKH